MAGRPCSMCSHPDKAAIEAALVDGRPVRAIGKEWRVSRDAIARHRGHMLLPLAQAQEVRAAVQEQVAADVAQALDVMDQLTRVFERTNLLLDACHRWLVDPEDPSRYDVGPRSSDVMVIYLDAGADGKERQRKAPLDVLLARLGEGGVAPIGYEVKHADPRELALKAVAQLRPAIELLGELRGDLDARGAINVTVSPEWVTIRAALLEALADYPDARTAVAARLRALEAA